MGLCVWREITVRVAQLMVLVGRWCRPPGPCAAHWASATVLPALHAAAHVSAQGPGISTRLSREGPVGAADATETAGVCFLPWALLAPWHMGSEISVV